MSAPLSHRTLWWLGLGMLLTALLCQGLRVRPAPEAQARAAVPLESLFPSSFAGWQQDNSGVVVIRPAFEKARQFQMYDQVLERTYVNAQGQSVMLSVAYGRQQSVGLQMHRPEVCYRSGGFQVDAVHADQWPLAGRSVPVTHLVARMVGRSEPVTYWRLLGDAPVADETQFKLQQLKLGLSGGVHDGLLVRISSIDPDVPAARRLHLAFAQALAQALSPAQQARVLGLAPSAGR